jgi:acyl-CoA dehydrogenase
VRSREGLALTWTAARLLNEVWQGRRPYSDQYHLFRLMTHLAKYWSTKFAVQTAKWCIEVHGGPGVLEEYRVERWLRGGMVLAIGDGTTLQQFLDALEMMARNQAHRLLIQRLQQYKRVPELDELQATIDRHMMLPAEERERELESLIKQLAQAAAKAMLSELKAQRV